MNRLKEARAEPQIFLKLINCSNRKFKKMIMLNQKGGFQLITALFCKMVAITQASYKEESVSKQIIR